MRKQIERIRQRATLTCDGDRTYRVSCDITVYRAYVRSDGYGGVQYSPGGIEVDGSIIPEDVPGPVPVGQESNILDLGNGRKLDINFKWQLMERFKSKRFSIHDEMTFYDTPLYKQEETG